jgi:hypothetical protein
MLTQITSQSNLIKKTAYYFRDGFEREHASN